ncbi:PhzF family phenazine biosynthesis protein [Pseudoxanthomonas dokdonensis]|uniref:Phenazine biosynthesis protein n=1 Tax=Pseudoxanthomonas dokdonensis TaxID=344882 RepID=A0A0R0CR17_9GAMM|nr:PhzF family phenazine biosynthesis protein [Pseudoxanthomonas dokdonensis]KRG68097.1 phenazine biosynthesis protein [Pseudoxanthomonas dokdonensis]
MTTRRYLQLDVFADRPGAGNPLAVILDSDGLDSAAMQSMAAWLNVSETVFFLPVEQPGQRYRIRIFTPGQELPFAGHPSVGAAWAALHAGLVDEVAELQQECAAGVLPVRNSVLAGSRIIELRTPAARRMPIPAATGDACSRWLPGARIGQLGAALWNNGPGWWLVELADASEVRRLQPDLAAIAALSRDTGAVGLAVFALTAAADAGQAALVTRAFCPADNVPEDPVTGSANACIAHALAAAGRLPGGHDHYLASQGRELQRDGRIQLRVDAQGEVWIGGQVQLVIQGTLSW